VEKVSGKTGPDLRPFIIKRAKAFARPWFAKKAYAHKGYSGSSGWTAGGILDSWMKEFDSIDASHTASAVPKETLEKAVDDFLTTLAGQVQ
jgi:hypothetical protein